MVLLSARLGYMSEEEAERVTKLYARVGLPLCFFLPSKKKHPFL